ncbi:hypothetical protein A2U01_0109483, partial [Trifolium medium]|nr:hypothetical protein [Trifolium medium]
CLSEHVGVSTLVCSPEHVGVLARARWCARPSTFVCSSEHVGVLVQSELV